MCVDESIAICRKRYAFLFDLTSSEQKFLDGILDRGEINVGLLNMSPELESRITRMPMLAWKCQNIKRYAKPE